MNKIEVNPNLICRKCGYQWRSRVDNPKACPNTRCQTRDWKTVPINNPKVPNDETSGSTPDIKKKKQEVFEW